MTGRRLGRTDATGESTDPVRFPDTLKSRFQDLREAINDLGRAIVAGNLDQAPADTLHRRIVERFNSLAEYVDSLPVVNVTSWKRVAWAGWAIALANLGLVIWVRWFR